MHKTVYDMRISDWSLDVCSSDLVPRSRSRGRIRLDRHDRESLRTATDGDLRMSAAILDWSLVLAQVLLVLAMAFAAFRLLKGPRAQDRVLGLDTLYVNGMLLLLLLGIRSGSTASFEAALIIALLGSVGTVAHAKFLLRGACIEIGQASGWEKV